MRATYLVCYDITKPRRLARVYKIMKGKGIHLQYSVFLCSLTWPMLIELKGMIEEVINPKADDVRIYPLPAGEKIISIGCGSRLPEGADLFLA